MREDVDFRGLVVELCQIDVNECDGTDAARLELGEAFIRKTSTASNWCRTREMSAWTSVEFALSRATSRWIGMRRY